ncbi:MAG TPA: acyl-CoA dehydrogenase family protein [Sandaracinaceae bacterium LLY-WYZ-13_1]|nr:acyl-CoA dehydrogenase family protein [Sandaracinaceae bacterium LLY-WYZ-13_1]
MGNFFKDNDDLRFYFEKGIDWGPLVELTEHGFRAPDAPSSTEEAVELYRDIAELVGGFVADEIAPHAAQIDREKVRFEDGEVVFPDRLAGIFDQIQEMELHSLNLPRELGGMNAPLMLYFLTSELFGRADVSVMAHHGFHGGMALAMLIFSVREGTTKVDPDNGVILETRFEDFIREIGRGDAWGCMDITEPDAGSDMAKLRTKGEQDADGRWTVTGQKLFITSGHGKYHFVIARTEASKDPTDPFAGLGGLSMFLVPTYEEKDGERTRLATVDRIEEKLGHHASVTAQISFEQTPAFLIGERGEGFKHMLTLMNNARLGVGFECLGLCEAAVRLAEGYAAERTSMGKTIDRHEMIADYLDEMRTDVQALRAVCVHGAFHEELATKKELHLRHAGTSILSDADRARLEREVKRHKKLARRVTPLLKYFGAEKAVQMARRCVQIHGGVGYTKEYGAEKLLRDAMVMPIYEGTSQIQALMAMKDTLGAILKDPRRFVRRGAQARWRVLSARDAFERRVARVQVASHAAQQHLLMRTAGDKLRGLGDRPVTEWANAFLQQWNPKRDFAFAMLHAERLTRILFDEAAAELLLAQAQAHPERREVLERWLDRAEPRSRALLDEIQTTGDRLLAQLGEAEAAAAAAE